jgi:hypothetical protein
MYCYECGKELPECDEHEPYPWVLVVADLYCLECANDNYQ